MAISAAALSEALAGSPGGMKLSLQFRASSAAAVYSAFSKPWRTAPAIFLDKIECGSGLFGSQRDGSICSPSDVSGPRASDLSAFVGRQWFRGRINDIMLNLPYCIDTS
jgi:hypothetical protein